MLEWDLFDEFGNRKYLTPEERQAYFEAISKALKRERRTFALMLYYTGCRISEALEVTPQRVDYAKKGVVLRSLKRRKTVYRFVPLPDNFLEKLDDVHAVKESQKDKTSSNKPIWNFNRVTGWASIKKVMKKAEIEGIQATPKGLRHSFAIAHQEMGTPEHMIQRWLGWASPAMLSVYGKALGKEERNLARKLWDQ